MAFLVSCIQEEAVLDTDPHEEDKETRVSRDCFAACPLICVSVPCPGERTVQPEATSISRAQEQRQCQCATWEGAGVSETFPASHLESPSPQLSSYEV